LLFLPGRIREGRSDKDEEEGTYLLEPEEWKRNKEKTRREEMQKELKTVRKKIKEQRN
jgi:hypothetical protein